MIIVKWVIDKQCVLNGRSWSLVLSKLGLFETFSEIFCKNRCFSHFDSPLIAANRILENGPSTTTLPSARGSVRSNISTVSSPSSSSSGDLPPLPNQWAETQDAHTGRTYFIDHLTRTTQWERPKALPSNWERRLDQEQNRIYRVTLLKCWILHSRGKSSFWGGKSHSGSVLVKKVISGHFRPFLGKKSSCQVIFGHFRDIFFNTTLYFVDHVNRKTQWTHPAENVQQTATRRVNNENRYNARYMPGQDDDDAVSDALRGPVTPPEDDFSALNMNSARPNSLPTIPMIPVDTNALPYPVPSMLTPTSALSTTPTRSPTLTPKNSVLKRVGQETFGKPISRQGSIDESTAVDINEIDKRFGKLGEPWEAKKQPNTGRCYYVNHRTKTSQWEDPRTFGLELTLRPPDGWQATTASDGTRYFINHTTKRTSWDPWQAENVPKKEDVYTRKAMSYMDKYSMFTRMCGFNSPEGHLKVPLKRERIFQSSFQYFMQDILKGKDKDAKIRHPGDYRKRLFIQFGNEEGLDYGGVSREFFYSVVSQNTIFAPFLQYFHHNVKNFNHFLPFLRLYSRAFVKPLFICCPTTSRTRNTACSNNRQTTPFE